MQDTTIVTGFSAAGYVEYGQRFMESFKVHNPGYELFVFTDGSVPLHIEHHYQQLDIPGLASSLTRWKNALQVHGKAPTDRWNDKERRAGYSYRFDMFKFCKMIYTMWGAAQMVSTEYMIWLDGDTVVRKQLPPDLAERSLPEGFDYAYLGREPKHTETGYLVFRLPEVMPILDAWVGYCNDDSFKLQKEWHSAFLFDRARERFPEINGYNLTPGGRGHVIHKCWVGQYFDHCKGNRKKRGRSPEAK